MRYVCIFDGCLVVAVLAELEQSNAFIHASLFAAAHTGIKDVALASLRLWTCGRVDGEAY